MKKNHSCFIRAQKIAIKTKKVGINLYLNFRKKYKWSKRLHFFIGKLLNLLQRNMKKKLVGIKRILFDLISF